MSILNADRVSLCSGCSPTNSGDSSPYRCCRPSVSVLLLPMMNSPAGTVACGVSCVGPAFDVADCAASLLFCLRPSSKRPLVSTSASDLQPVTYNLFFVGVFGAAKTECVIVHLQCEKGAIVNRCGNAAFVK